LFQYRTQLQSLNMVARPLIFFNEQLAAVYQIHPLMHYPHLMSYIGMGASHCHGFHCALKQAQLGHSLWVSH
jgi:hypothetical protein